LRRPAALPYFSPLIRMSIDSLLSVVLGPH
jgi:hypothetical protein